MLKRRSIYNKINSMTFNQINSYVSAHLKHPDFSILFITYDNRNENIY